MWGGYVVEKLFSYVIACQILTKLVADGAAKLLARIRETS